LHWQTDTQTYTPTYEQTAVKHRLFRTAWTSLLIDDYPNGKRLTYFDLGYQRLEVTGDGILGEFIR